MYRHAKIHTSHYLIVEPSIVAVLHDIYLIYFLNIIYSIRLTIVAMPCPTPIHIVAKP